MKKLKIGIFGISGCAGCLLTFIYEDLLKLVDVKSFPLIKEDSYKGQFDYVFIEGTVCFDKDILKIKKLRKRAKYVVALGSCACFGGVPSIKNFMDKRKAEYFVYPKINHLNSEDPTPLDKHIKVDYFIPQCPPNKEEITRFIKLFSIGKKPKTYVKAVCFECKKKGIHCLLEDNKICIGPITSGGCKAICPENKTGCYGCRGPCPDANFDVFSKLLIEKGCHLKQIQEIMQTFAGLQFMEKEKKSRCTIK